MSKLQIDSSRWAELSQLLDQAMDLPPAERVPWVDTLGDQFSDLKSPLRDLLSRSASVETGDFLHTLPKFGVPDEQVASELHSGIVVGGYRLERELGQGGMGSVWLAQRADGVIQRPVALKLPHLVAARRAGLAERLARERDILATLDHPNIAKLLDAGITEDGQPFIALEYIEGVPVDRHCGGGDAGPAPGLSDTLRLFRQVAEAVAYAHTKLVLHRDLKPANILVAARDQVKLLDFGIAKLLDEGQARETALTAFAGRALTPEYASPEQIAGQSLTVASDVYSLGVILFEMLAGTRPYRLKSASRSALEDAILAGEVPRLSRVSTRSYRQQLAGDLDTIVAKALKRDLRERYPTVHALVEDISRVLAQRPILARDDSFLYRARKFVARNRLAVGASAAVGIAVLGAAAVAMWQAHLLRIEQQRTLAVKESMISIFSGAEPYASGGKSLGAADLLKLAFAEQMARPLDDVRARAEILTVIAASLVGLEDYEEAQRVANAAVEHAQAYFSATDPLLLEARLVRANTLRHRNPPEDLLREVATMLPALRANEEAEPRQLIEGLLLRAHAAIDDRDLELAVASANEAIGLCRQYLQANDRTTIEAFATASVAHSFAGQPKEALATAQQALESARAAFAEQPDHPLVIQTRGTYARALDASERDEDSIREYEAAYEGAVKVWGPDSSTAGGYKHTLSKLRLELGDIRGGNDDAVVASRIAARVNGERSQDYVFRKSVEVRGLLAARRSREALAGAAPMLALEVELFGADDVGALETHAAHTMALAELGDCRAAESAAERIAAVPPQGGGASLTRLRRYLGRIGRLCDNLALASQQLAQALTAATKDKRLLEIGAVHGEIGLLGLAQRRYADAERDLNLALRTLDAAGHRATPTRADVEMGMSEVKLAQNQPKEALAPAQRARDFWREFDSSNVYARRSEELLRRVERHLAAGTTSP